MHRKIALSALVAATLLVATACSSSSKSSSSSSSAAGGATTSAAAGGSSSASSSAASSTTIQAAIDAVAKYSVRPTQIEVTTPVGAPVPKGKTVEWLQCPIPACTQLGDGLKAATDALGWKLKIIDSGLTAETIANAWAKAAANKHDAVIAISLLEPER